MINYTHLLIFTSDQTNIMTKILPKFTNILMFFREDTTFKINETEFNTLSFDQEDKIEIVQLTLQDSLILISGVDGVISIELNID